jgi:hypothetical protein
MALFSVKLSDCVVLATVVRQSETYGAFIEGRITAKMNERIVKRAVEKAGQLWPGIPVWQLCPIDCFDDSPFPRVQCFSLLYRDEFNDDPERDPSSVVLVHYENEVCPHLSEPTMRRISEMQWRTVIQNAVWT